MNTAADYMIATFTDGPIKPCKGCRHFNNSNNILYCEYKGEWISHIDPLSKERVRRHTNLIKAEWMRSAHGLCKPERKLYETFWQAFWKVLSGK